jgi:hypothetical protein
MLGTARYETFLVAITAKLVALDQSCPCQKTPSNRSKNNNKPNHMFQTVVLKILFAYPDPPKLQQEEAKQK